MKVWVMFYAAEDSATEIYGVYTSKEAAYPDFVKQAESIFKFKAAENINATEDVISAGNGLDYLVLERTDLHEQAQLP
jgi:hypothetical protein